MFIDYRQQFSGVTGGGATSASKAASRQAAGGGGGAFQAAGRGGSRKSGGKGKAGSNRGASAAAGGGAEAGGPGSWQMENGKNVSVDGLRPLVLLPLPVSSVDHQPHLLAAALCVPFVQQPPLHTSVLAVLPDFVSSPA